MQIHSKPWNPHREGKRILEKLKNAEGGAWDPAIAAHHLGISVEELHQLAAKRSVVAWTDPDGGFHFPTWQFGEAGLLPGILGCLSELRGSDEWAVMRFFLSVAESAGNVSPLHLLRQGKIERALKAACSQSIRA
jgi:hypothetical protein